MGLFEVNEKTCNQDGICAAICPPGIINFSKGEYPTSTADAEQACLKCGHCVAVCPTGSLNHIEMRVEECPPITKQLHLSPEHCEHFLRNRRSIRAYKKKSVSRDDLVRLIEIARYAPTGHNSQCVEWLVLANSDELKTLCGIVADWMQWMINNHPQIALPLNMDRTLNRWKAGNDVVLRGAPAVVVAHADKDSRPALSACTIALTYLDLAATSMGLGCCWAGYFNSAATMFPPMLEALSLPKNHKSYGAMMVGYPKFAYHRLPLRKAPEIEWRL
ncbi:nitroreductase family protein [Thermodesulfobacteriota bacterium]